jgi:flavodoxin
MSILIVYDSIFGNTAGVAKAMADELAKTHAVKLASVQDARKLDLSGVDLLLVGSPTRGFRPTPEIQEFASRPDLPKWAAVFDTRIDLETIHPAPLRWVVQAGGYAAERLRTELMEQGCTLIGEPEGFLVLGQEGPLRDNELQRAAAWARGLVQSAPPGL